jgi:gliding motility-associated-like protein
MKVYFRIVLVFTLFLLNVLSSFAQITVNTTNTPTQLVNGVLIPSGSGTTVSNVVFRGVYNNGGNSQVGSFSTATTTLAQMGFSDGIVLATGNVQTIPLTLGANPGATQWTDGYSSCVTGEIRETGTCPTTNPAIVNDLNILAGTTNFYNAAILEFDFIPVENSVSFRYIFGSDEYNDSSNSAFDTNYNCSRVNDKFGFLISGPGIVGGQGFDNNARNIARLANGSEVSINSVNDGIVGSSYTQQGASYCQAANTSWVQNTPSPEFLGTIDGTELNGNTKILTAIQTGLTPGATYHIKLIITELEFANYDSVVYLEAGSFTTESTCNAGPDQSLCATTSATLAAVSPATGSWSVVSGSGTFVSNTNPNTTVNGLSIGANVFRWTASDLSCYADVTITVTAAPLAPTGLACYQTATFNNTTCIWDVTGTQPAAPTGLACYQTATFNNTTCIWDVTGSPYVITTTSGCNGVDYELSAIVSSGLATYEWFNSSSVSLGTTPTISITSTGTYEVRVTLNGCTVSDFVTVDNAFCMIPKGISPNNDGKNDSWNLSNLNVEKAQIFNRYGVEVYSKNNYTDEWDGRTDSGKELPTATYYYVLTFSNGTVKTGWVYLNRVN